MSSVINPVGPEEPRTYWLRRVLVIVALLAVVGLLWLLIGLAMGPDSEPAAEAPSPSPSFGLSISPEPEESSPEPGGSAGAATPSASPSASDPQRCRNAAIEVAASTSASSTPAGAGLGLTMTVTSTAGDPCTRDVGAGANELRITSGSVLVWSSDFCNPSDAEQLTVLDRDTSWSTSITWPGTVTAEECPARQPTAQPGTYRVVARNGSVESEPVTFTVS